MGYFEKHQSPETSTRSKDQAEVFLKNRGITTDFLYKKKILREGTDVTEFVDEMRKVESHAREFDTHLRWFADDGNSMAYVAPKAEKNTINFNLSTIAFNSKGSCLGNY